MHAMRFDAAIDNILERDRRFEPGAFFLLKEALDFTLKRTLEEGGQERHVSGQELALGFRDYVLQEFGPMAFTLLREWGVHTCSDLGDMVFLLIEEGMFGKQDSDTKEDFCDHYDFEEALLKPFRPSARVSSPPTEQIRPDARPSDDRSPFSAETQDAT